MLHIQALQTPETSNFLIAPLSAVTEQTWLRHASSQNLQPTSMKHATSRILNLLSFLTKPRILATISLYVLAGVPTLVVTFNGYLYFFNMIND